MDNDCNNCSSCSTEKNNKYIVKFRLPLSELEDYSKEELEEILNNTEGILDAIIKDDELIIDYDDIIISPEELKKTLKL